MTALAHHDEQLTPQSAEVVQATAGVVAKNAIDISVRFYDNLFKKYPQLKSVFNMSHQAAGEQQVALAASVVHFAVALLDPTTFDQFKRVERRIAHKHSALGVQPAHYDIVGEELMGAIGEILGDAVTPEVANAWLEVYTKFANRLIAAEKELYAEAGTNPEHPWRTYRVSERIEESPRGFSLWIRPVEGSLPPHRPGQYVSVLVKLDENNDYSQPRQYSISGERDGEYRITVARVKGTAHLPAGAVSTWLDLHTREGAELQISQPAGDVVVDLQEAKPLLLISGGSGITPIIGVLEAVAKHQPHRTVRFYHADTDPGSQMLRPAVQAAARQLSDFHERTWFEDQAEAPSAESGWRRFIDPVVMDLSDPNVEVPADASVFMCGPLGFMRAMRRTLVEDRGINPVDIAYEVFGSDMYPADLPKE